MGFFHSKVSLSKKQRKLLGDTESGSIRLHRPLLFDPPREKMKGTEGGEKKEKQGRTGLQSSALKKMLVVFGEKVRMERRQWDTVPWHMTA